MANPHRTPGKHGWRRRDYSKHVPIFEDYLAGSPGDIAVITPPPTVDDFSKVPDWPMYANGPDPHAPPEIASTGVGDCTIASPAHGFSAECVYAGAPFPTFADTEIIKAYSAVGGYVLGDEGTDNGADPTVVCRYLMNPGLTDTAGKTHTLAAWAALRDPGNMTVLKTALDLGGTVLLAASLQEAQEEQFANEQAWEYVAGSPGVGGHAFCLQRVNSGGLNIYYVITWGTFERANRPFMSHCVGGGAGEGYVVVSQDFVDANGTSPAGFNLQQMISDSQAVSQE